MLDDTDDDVFEDDDEEELDDGFDSGDDDDEDDEDDEDEPDEENDIFADDPGGPFRFQHRVVARTQKELAEWMEKYGYYPNVWWVSDHGNVHPVTLDD